MPLYTQGTQYATREQLGQLGLIGGVLTSIPTATQDAALAAASMLADSQIQAQYVLPLQQWGLDLVRAVCIIAAYDLVTSKGYNPAAGADPNFRTRYEDSISWLDRVSKGQETLAYAIDSSHGGGDGGGGQATAPPEDGSPVFSTQGGFQFETTAVRGWTERGGRWRDPDSGGNGRGPL